MPDLIPWGVQEISRLKQDLDKLLNALFEDLGVRCPDFPGEGMSVAMKEGWWIVTCALPGCAPEEVDVTVAGRTLSIVAAGKDKSCPRIARRLTMPQPIALAEAEFSDGRLVVRVSCQPPAVSRQVMVIRKTALDTTR